MGTPLEPHLVEIGAIMRAARLEQNMPQTELAERCGIPRTTIVQVENGQRDTAFTTMVILAARLGVSADEIAAPVRKAFCR